MHHKLKQKAIFLRTERKLSYNAILEQVPVAKSTLSNWLGEYPLSSNRILELKRLAGKKNEARVELFRATMREKREREDDMVYQKYLKRFKKPSKGSLFVAGLMLYLAEGSKTNRNRVVITNTDYRMLKFFINWLELFFGVARSRVKLYIQLYKTMDARKEVDLWATQLNVPKSQIYKPFLRELKPASFSYKESFRHGTCAIILNNTSTRREIMMAIKAYLNNAFSK